MTNLTINDIRLAVAYNKERNSLSGQYPLYPFDTYSPSSVTFAAFTMLYQAQVGLTVDGKFGPETEANYFEQMSADKPPTTPPVNSSGLLEWVEVPATQVDDRGYDHFKVRSDVAEQLQKVSAVLAKCGAVLTSSGGRRRLSAEVGANRSATSFHYTGRAIDLYVYSGMVDPNTDPFVLQYEGNYRVFARCSNPEQIPGVYRVRDGVDIKPATYNHRFGVRGVRLIPTPFLDFTTLMEKYGFFGIDVRESFIKGGPRGGAEWWHFQYERGLQPGITTFGDELLKIYPLSKLEGTAPWRYRDRVFGDNWG